MSRFCTFLVGATLLFNLPAFGQYSPYYQVPRSSKPRPWYERIRIFSTYAKSIDGQPRPKGATMYYREPIPENFSGVWTPRIVFLYPGESVRKRLHHPAPPHLYVNDPTRLPPEYELVNYEGFQTDLHHYHGTQIVLSFSGFEKEEQRGLQQSLQNLWQGVDDGQLELTHDYGLKYNGKSIPYNFSYVVGGKHYSFQGINRTNIVNRYKAHVRAVLADSRYKKLSTYLERMEGNNKPEYSPEKLNYPLTLNNFLEKKCEPYEFRRNTTPKGLEVRYKGNSLFMVPDRKIRSFRYRCEGESLFIIASEVIPASKDQHLSVDSDVQLVANKAYRDLSALYFFHEGKLISGKKKPLGGTYELGKLVELNDGETMGFRIPIEGGESLIELQLDGRILKRPNIAGWKCTGQYRLQGSDVNHLVISRVFEGKEVPQGVVTGLQSALCSKDTLVFVAESFVPDNSLSVSLSGSSSEFEVADGSGAKIFVVNKNGLSLVYRPEKKPSGLTNMYGRMTAKLEGGVHLLELDLSKISTNYIPNSRELVQSIREAGYDLSADPKNDRLRLSYEGRELVEGKSIRFETKVGKQSLFSFETARALPGLDLSAPFKNSSEFGMQARQYILLHGADLKFISSSGVEEFETKGDQLIFRDGSGLRTEVDLVEASAIIRPDIEIGALCSKRGYAVQRLSNGRIGISHKKGKELEHVFTEVDNFDDIYCASNGVLIIGNGEAKWHYFGGEVQPVVLPDKKLKPESVESKNSKIEIKFEGVDAFVGVTRRKGFGLDLEARLPKACSDYKISFEEDKARIQKRGKHIDVAGLKSVACLFNRLAVVGEDVIVGDANPALFPNGVTYLWVGSLEKMHMIKSSQGYSNAEAIKVYDLFRVSRDGKKMGVSPDGVVVFPKAIELPTECQNFHLKRTDVEQYHLSQASGMELLSIDGLRGIACVEDAALVSASSIANVDSRPSLLSQSPFSISLADKTEGSKLAYVQGDELRALKRAPGKTAFKHVLNQNGQLSAWLVGEETYCMKFDTTGDFTLIESEFPENMSGSFVTKELK